MNEGHRKAWKAWVEFCKQENILNIRYRGLIARAFWTAWRAAEQQHENYEDDQ